MANMNLPLEERNMTPDQVERSDQRRQWGLVLQVIVGPVRLLRDPADGVGGTGSYLFARLEAPDGVST